jgi:hypothetical protein
MGSPVIFKGSLAKVLTSRGVELKDGTFILSGNLNPNVTPVDAPPGSLYLSTLTTKQYMKADEGATTNWVTPGAGTQGPQGPQGEPGESYAQSFETVSKNLKEYSYELTYVDDILSYITYYQGGGQTIVKTFYYTETGELAMIELSGNLPYGISMVKVFEYDEDGNLYQVAYGGTSWTVESNGGIFTMTLWQYLLGLWG